MRGDLEILELGLLGRVFIFENSQDVMTPSTIIILYVDCIYPHKYKSQC